MWRGLGRLCLLKISIFLVVAGKAGNHQKRVILGGLAALQTALRGRLCKPYQLKQCSAVSRLFQCPSICATTASAFCMASAA
jgi:hypothetical protein